MTDTANSHALRFWGPPIAVLALICLAWYLRYAVMLFFGAALVAATFLALAQPLLRLGLKSQRMALGFVLLALPFVLTGVFWWIGEPLAAQVQSLTSDLPQAWAAMRTWLNSKAWGYRLQDLLNYLPDLTVPWSGIAGLARGTLHAISASALVVLMGAYLAFDVSLYKCGIARLFPPRHRERVGDALDEAGSALTRWLMGQGLTMLAVGTLSCMGLWLLGMPLALALGVISGLLEFVPFFGSIAAGLLAVLVAFVQGPQMALYVGLLYIAIQQIEGNLLVPLIQRWAVSLPPALGLASVIVFGSIFGVGGVVFGTPLMVVTMVIVRKLYVEQTLEGQHS